MVIPLAHKYHVVPRVKVCGVPKIMMSQIFNRLPQLLLIETTQYIRPIDCSKETLLYGAMHAGLLTHTCTIQAVYLLLAEHVILFYSILLTLYSASTEGLQQHVLQP